MWGKKILRSTVLWRSITRKMTDQADYLPKCSMSGVNECQQVLQRSVIYVVPTVQDVELGGTTHGEMKVATEAF